MSEYLLELSYTSNKDKAAKLKIKNENGKTLFQSDAVIPNSLHNCDKYIHNLRHEKFIFKEYSKSNIYADSQRISLYEKTMGDSYIFSYDKSLKILKNNSFYSEKGKKVSGIDEVITLSNDAFDVLAALIANPKNTVNLKATQSWFLLGQKKCERTYDVSVDNYIKLAEKIFNEEDLIKLKLRSQQMGINAKTTNKKVDVVIPSNQDVPKKEVFLEKQKKSEPKQSLAYSNITNTSNNDLDPFDLMYMTAFPELAPFYRPTSGIAWMLYFNHQHDHDNFVNNPVKCINKIEGFEDVNSCDIKIKGENSYKVDMYSDKDKSNYLGTLNYSPEKGLSIKDDNGNQSFVSEMKDKPGYNILIEGENSSKALIEVVQNKHNELVGNWTIEPHNSIMATSSMKINEDLSLSSDINKIINLDNVQLKDQLNISNFINPENNNLTDLNNEYGLKTNQSFENDNNFKYEPPPPPPPPPPPEDNFKFTSENPYSRTGYSM